MKIVFFTQDDPFYIKVFFDEFLGRCGNLEEIRAIVISRPMGKKSTWKLARQMYDFYGPVDFIRVGMRYAFLKFMSRTDPGKIKPGIVPRTYSLKQLAGVYGIPVIERSDLNSKAFQDMIRTLEPDLFISIAAPIIFKEDLINIPKIDCINIHNSPLPNYRGMLPNFWQLYHGEENVGITIHKIDKGIDTGDIIRQDMMPIGRRDTLNDLIIKTKRYNAMMIREIIEDYREGRVRYRKMEGKGSYFSFPTRDDVIEFRKKGRKLI